MNNADEFHGGQMSHLIVKDAHVRNMSSRLFAGVEIVHAGCDYTDVVMLGQKVRQAAQENWMSYRENHRSLIRERRHLPGSAYCYQGRPREIMFSFRQS
jgi:hypothetical protein